MELLLLERFAYLPQGTFGVLTMPGGFQFQTAERPWLLNQPYISCIPEGEYSLLYRKSDTIRRITKGLFLVGWEIEDVPGRTGILLHTANWPSGVQGCVGLGKKFELMRDPSTNCPFGVTESGASFEDFMGRMKVDGDYRIKVTSKRAELAL